MKQTIKNFLKSSMDKAGALSLLIVLSPLFVFLIYQIKRDGGPAFYGQIRVGQNGHMFKCWKFRSMVVNADKILQDLLKNDPEARAEWDRDFKLKNDPRITRIGHFIRKTSIDELPQLFNVLKGEMSLVGPRPVTKAEKRFYGEDFEKYKSVRPGMTGLWQVSGRNDVTYKRRVLLDVWYVDHWSILADIRIMFQTIRVVLYRSGSY